MNSGIFLWLSCSYQYGSSLKFKKNVFKASHAHPDPKKKTVQKCLRCLPLMPVHIQINVVWCDVTKPKFLRLWNRPFLQHPWTCEVQSLGFHWLSGFSTYSVNPQGAAGRKRLKHLGLSWPCQPGSSILIGPSARLSIELSVNSNDWMNK